MEKNKERIKYKGAVILVQDFNDMVYHVAISHKAIRDLLIIEQKKGNGLKFSAAIPNFFEIMKIDFNIE